ncbi:nucleoside 2-deoxyribosyltransferase domain-containing protein [uncultured Methanoregula sp.]|uniref:nucleoside 2-deoxyribosyltransferase n=1 Tax=uncultured Methanoregula sp. TaxID=1005933 RepID=UPI002AAC46EE|nr:nucleoside 2-deoxyribosyltransferase domain-containing protein [uncultured Methanoregula sp.]
MKKRVYIAGPLFSQAELDFNENVEKSLNDLGYETFLPQRDGHTLSDLISRGEPEDDAIKKIFELDVREIQKSDILLLILDGRVPDEGACVELGIAYANKKECIGLKTDSRCLMENLDNPLILGALDGKIARSIDDLRNFL